MISGPEGNGAYFRVVAPSSQKALRMVPEQLEPDEVIFSSRVTVEGIEIVVLLEETTAALLIGTKPSAEPASMPVSRPQSAKVKPSQSSMSEEGLIDQSVTLETHSMRSLAHLLRGLLGIGIESRRNFDPGIVCLHQKVAPRSCIAALASFG